MRLEEIEAKTKLAKEEQKLGNIEYSTKIANEVIHSFSNSKIIDPNFVELYIEALLIEGWNYRILGHPEIAINKCLEAVTISEQYSFTYLLGYANNVLGVNYLGLSDFEKALDCFIKTLLIYEEIDQKNGIGGLMINIGLVYHNLSDYENSLEYQSKALMILEELGDITGVAIATVNLGAIYQQFKDFEKAIEYQKKALNIYEEIDDKLSIALVTGNIGICYGLLNDSEKALEQFLISYNIREEIGDKRGIASAGINLGTVYSLKGSALYDSIKSEQFLKKSLDIAIEIESKEMIQYAYSALHNLRINEEKYEEALEYYKKSVEIEKEIQSEDAKNKAQLFDQRRKIEEDEKARQLKLARFQEQEKILHNILPINIADRILQQETFIADHFESVSVLFMDLVGFTKLSSTISPKQLVSILDAIFTLADEVLDQFGLEKIKTIGDGYLAVANVTSPLVEHQKATALAALQLLETMKNFTVTMPTDLGDTNWIKDMNDIEIRIGIHTGAVVAGIIGKNKYTYDLWGDAVNIASRMESHSEAGRIQISEAFAKSIESYPEFNIINRGEISIKGKGTMNTYWLEKRK